jgi:serine protease AprX
MATADHFRPRRHKTEPYLALQSTSMSTPFVAGVVALMLQRCKTLTPKDVRELLTKSAKAPEGHEKDRWDHGFGYGLLDTKELFKLLECR